MFEDGSVAILTELSAATSKLAKKAQLIVNVFPILRLAYCIR